MQVAVDGDVVGLDGARAVSATLIPVCVPISVLLAPAERDNSSACVRAPFWLLCAAGLVIKLATACEEFGETLQLSGSKEGLKFQVKGDIGSGNVLLKPRESEKPEESICSSGLAVEILIVDIKTMFLVVVRQTFLGF